MTDILADEGSSVLYTFGLQDEDGADVVLDDVAALTLTVYDASTRTIINNRDDFNLLTADAFTFSFDSAEKLFAVRLSGDDTAIVRDTASVERHHMELCATLDNGTTRNWRRVMKVTNLSHVGA